MGYGAVFSDDQRNNPNYEQARQDWETILRHPEVAVHPDGGGRATLHRQSSLVVAIDDLNDRRLTEHRIDLGISDDSYERARSEADRKLGFVRLDLTPGQDVVGTARFLRNLGGRLPLRVGPDHVLWPMEGRVYGPAMPPRPPATTPAARTLKAQATKSLAASSTTTVGVLDTGYVPGNPLTDACTVSSEADPWWDASNSQLTHWVGAHGTHAAGVLAAAAGGMVRIRHYNVGQSFGTELPLIADTDLAVAVSRALDDGCRVLNLSLGGPAALELGLPATALAARRVLGTRTAKGQQRDDAVIVASAGNEGTSEPMYPAALKGVVAVGALKPDGDRAEFSNYGPWVDCATSGVDVLGPHITGKGGPIAPTGQRDDFAGWAEWSGTSFAAPFVAGRIAAEIARGTVSARIAAAITLANGTPLDPALGVGVRIS